MVTAGSFAFLRLLVSLTIRGWEEGFNAIRAAFAYVSSMMRGTISGNKSEQSMAAKKIAAKYQARGRNPLASPLKQLLGSTSKSNPNLFRQAPNNGAQRAGGVAVRLCWDFDEASEAEAAATPSRPSSLDTPKHFSERAKCHWSSSRPCMHTPISVQSLDLAYLSAAQQSVVSSPALVDAHGGRLWSGKMEAAGSRWSRLTLAATGTLKRPVSEGAFVFDTSGLSAEVTEESDREDAVGRVEEKDDDVHQTVALISKADMHETVDQDKKDDSADTHLEGAVYLEYCHTVLVPPSPPRVLVC
jgi:hypothetical protein